MKNQKLILYGGSAIVVTIGMLLIKGISYVFTKAVVTMLQ